MSGFLTRWMVNWLYPRLCAVLRMYWPVARFGRYVLVTRFDDAQEVLTRSDEFVVPYQKKIADIGWLPISLLAMERRNAAYDATSQILKQLWTTDDLERVSRIGTEVTRSALAHGGGRVDAVRDIVVPSAQAIVERYYGVKLSDAAEFTRATYAVAGYIFGAPNPDAAAIARAAQQIQYIQREIELAIDAAIPSNSAEATVIERWLAISPRVLARNEFVCLMTHMIMGFLPAHTNAGGRALEVLLTNPDAREAAIAAASAEHGDINQIGYEALRFMYILPVVWRTNEAMVELRRETTQPVRIPANANVMVSLGSAMQDSRRLASPHKFHAGRSPAVYMTFGHGFHECVGRGISDRLMAANLRGLFGAAARRQPGTRTTWKGMIPAAIPVLYSVSG